MRVWIGRSWSRKASAIGAEARQGVLVAVRDRLVAPVPAREHQRDARVRAEQVMQRAVGQHHPELAGARGDRGRHARAGPPGREHDRPRDASQQRAGGVAEHHEVLGRRDVGGQQRERLVLAMLAGAQLGDRARIVGAAGQVVAADALDGDDRPVPEQRGGRRDGVGGGALAPVASGQPRPRPAAGQARGWAWKRRSRGSSYSARQSAHIAKPAIVVSGRS